MLRLSAIHLEDAIKFLEEFLFYNFTSLEVHIQGVPQILLRTSGVSSTHQNEGEESAYQYMTAKT
jgi:hypothetical protein